MRGDGSVAGEERVVGVQKFHSWAKCTMPLTNINSDWVSNASSGLCIRFKRNCTRRCSYEVSAAGLSWLKSLEFSAIRIGKSSLLLSY